MAAPPQPTANADIPPSPRDFRPNNLSLSRDTGGGLNAHRLRCIPTFDRSKCYIVATQDAISIALPYLYRSKVL